MNAPVLLSLTDALARLQAEPELFMVYDGNVEWVASQLLEVLPVRASMLLETSEEGKTLQTVQMLERWLLQADASRGALLLAVGGGITTDLVGFTAAIYKRGIRYANVPTTREFRCGLAELLKTFLIGDGAAYTKAVRSLAAGQNQPLLPLNTLCTPSCGAEEPSFAPDKPDLPDLLRKAAAIKSQIVTEDPEEHGVRAKLNLGHTFGHAIEHEARVHGDNINHGEAVAMGIILAAELSERLGVAQKGLSTQLKADFSLLGLPVESPYPVEDLLEALRKDKKAVTGEKVKFVLLRAPGDVILQELPYDCYLHTK